MKKLLVLFIAVLASCSKDAEQPVVIPSFASKPVLFTTRISQVNNNSAVSGGKIANDGGAPITAKGVCWGTATSPTVALSTKTNDGSGKTEFTSQLSDLAEGTTYFYRSYATNSAGTSYGEQRRFDTHIDTPPITDADGNTYQTIKIGTQLWMQENLKTTKYCNGDEIPSVTTNTWFSLTTPAWTYYNNDSNNDSNGYGKLYNWYAMRDARNICPCGWHVPTKAEWETMANYLGGLAAAGEAMKSTTGWIQNDWATNSSGFTGLPAGLKLLPNTVLYDKWDGAWWQNTGPYGEAKQLHVDSSYLLNPVFDEEVGLSIRCVKD
jgi:uncharacterized protein (TIGR02145 family)